MNTNDANEKLSKAQGQPLADDDLDMVSGGQGELDGIKDKITEAATQIVGDFMDNTSVKIARSC